MHQPRLFLILLFIVFFYSTFKSFAEEEYPDTVSTGIYITSIHNIDFKEKEYNINFWLWLKYKNQDFDFTKNLEIPEAKTFTSSYTTVDTTTDGRIYLLMKLQCVMKDSWKINHFPFDYQMLRLTIENSQYDTSSLVFVADTVGAQYGRFTISGWTIDPDSFKITVRNQAYNTAFGDDSYAKPFSSYSAFRVKIGIQRLATWTLFWKIFLGMYVAFFIAYVCFYIHPGNVESRFGLNVGALFAAVGNKYIIDSSLPDSTSPTLVDALHSTTLIFIFAVIASTIYSLKLVREYKVAQANKFDKVMGTVLFITYLILNIYFVSQAAIN